MRSLVQHVDRNFKVWTFSQWLDVHCIATQGKATQADGSPAASERVKVTATANNGRKTLLDKTVRTDANGAISQTVKLGNDINCLKFTVSHSLHTLARHHILYSQFSRHFVKNLEGNKKIYTGDLRIGHPAILCVLVAAVDPLVLRE